MNTVSQLARLVGVVDAVIVQRLPKNLFYVTIEVGTRRYRCIDRNLSAAIDRAVARMSQKIPEGFEPPTTDEPNPHAGSEWPYL